MLIKLLCEAATV